MENKPQKRNYLQETLYILEGDYRARAPVKSGKEISSYELIAKALHQIRRDMEEEYGLTEMVRAPESVREMTINHAKETFSFFTPTQIEEMLKEIVGTKKEE